MKKGSKYIIMVATVAVLITALFAFPAGAADNNEGAIVYQGTFGKSDSQLWRYMRESPYYESPLVEMGDYLGAYPQGTKTTVTSRNTTYGIAFDIEKGKKYVIEFEYSLFMKLQVYKSVTVAINTSSGATKTYTNIPIPKVEKEYVKVSIEYLATSNSSRMDIVMTFDMESDNSYKEIRFKNTKDGLKIYDSAVMNDKDDTEKDFMRSRENVQSRGKDTDDAKAQQEKAQAEINSATAGIAKSQGYQSVFGVVGHLVVLFSIPIGIIGVTFLIIILIEKGAS